MLQFPQLRFDPRRRSKTSYQSPIHRFRGLLTIGLVALLFLEPLSLVSGQQLDSASKDLNAA